MLSFPQNPVLICRKCLSQIVLRSFPLICPKCDLEETASQAQINKLINFYPRLLAAREILAGHGFQWSGYTFKKEPMTVRHHFESLKFHCVECAKGFSVTSVRGAKLAKEPVLFCCPHCRKHPKLNKDTKEFFVSFDNFNLGTTRLMKFQFDLFLPLGRSHSEADLQWPIYRTTAE